MSAEDTSLGESVLVLSTDNNGFRMGIDDAQMAANAMQKNLDAMQNHIKDRFAEKFEHVGVHLFGHDLLQAMGITEGARPILGALQMGVNSLAESFGIATGPIGLIVMGLTAVAAIGYKVYESHEKHAESLKKVEKEQVEAFKTTHELGEELEAYNGLLHGITPELDKLADATKKLDDIQRHNLLTTEAKLVLDTGKAITANQEQQEGVREYIAELQRQQSQMSKTSFEYAEMTRVINGVTGQLGKLKDKSDELNATAEKTKADMKAQAEGYLNLEDKIKKVTKALEEKEKADKKEEEEFDRWNKKQDEMLKKEEEVGKAWEATSKRQEAAMTHLGTITKEVEQDGAAATTNAYEKKKAEIEKYRIAKQAEIDRIHLEAVANAQTQDQILAANRAHATANAALSNTIAQKTSENYRAIGAAAISLGKTIESSFATSAAHAIVTSKGMHDSWIAISQQIKEQIIADGIKMGIEYVAQAAKGILMHHSIATAAAASATAQVSSNAAVIASNQAKTASVVQLTVALNAATVAATALDIALAAAV